MAIDPVKIPQNVYIADRIVGPLTLKQIIVMAVGGGFSYAVYASMVKTFGALSIFTTIIIWIPAVIAAAFALVKINDLSLMRIVFLTMERMGKAPVRTWTPREGISINIRVLARQESETEQTKRTQAAQRSGTEAQKKIEELSAVLDNSFDAQADAADQAAMRTEAEHVITASPAPVAQTVTTVEPEVEDTTPRSLPVKKDRVSVDGKPALGDLAVFRDIFPPKPHGA